MKKLIVILLLFAIHPDSKAQDNRLPGTWSIIECAYVSSDGTTKVMENEIKAGTAVTDYVFSDNGNYKMTSNMSGSGTKDTWDGTWKTSDNNLAMTITVNNQQMDIVWKYELKDNVLVLSRTSPDGTITIKNSFRKK